MPRSYTPITAKEIDPLSFLISDCPAPEDLDSYIQILKSHNISNVIRISQPTFYDATVLETAGINVHEFYFEDGKCPSQEILDRFFLFVHQRQTQPTMVAIHCVSGIGRAPLLVCCALVEGGMDRLNAVEFMRKHRKGAINNFQLQWITDSKKGFKLKKTGFFKNMFSKK